ncbi:MFS transporter [Siccirubricoccus sp. G192]|uniref:MFS transporter n=1 Tax=Siccirubricoccus sp. G192 TaxID=2849651 RepID=UPI001C2B8690|nr:MFS transporter [Siccirubricoccus sp. G192]MBV1800419.1 MFS transporter [Siccirubricoccus sp. G192]
MVGQVPFLRRPIAPRQSASGRPQEVFFGWRVVATAFATALFSWGIGFFGPAIYLRTLLAEHGWAVSAVSAAVTAHFLVAAALVSFLPEAHRRFGVAGTTRAGVVLLAAGALGWALTHEPWQAFLAAALSGAGWAATNGAALNAMVAPWFERRRPAALAMAFNGGAVGGVLFPLLWVALIAGLGFPGAAVVVGAAALLVLWPLAGRYLRPTPASLGLAPDGEAEMGAAGPVTGAAAGLQCPHLVPAPRGRLALLRERRFATMSVAFALCMSALVGLYAHMLALLAPRLGDAAAAGALSLAAGCMVAGRTGVGWVLGRGGSRRAAAAATFGAQACGGGALLLGAVVMPPGTASTAMALAGCALLGLAGGATSACCRC